MRKSLAGASLAILIAGVAAGSDWLGTRATDKAPQAAAAPQAPAKGAAPPGVAVEAVKVSMSRMPQALSAVGSLRSDETVMVRPEIAGRVGAIDQHVNSQSLKFSGQAFDGTGNGPGQGRRDERDHSDHEGQDAGRAQGDLAFGRVEHEPQAAPRSGGGLRPEPPEVAGMHRFPV